MPIDDDRPDLAAMVVPLGRSLVAAEEPVLRDHALTMWGYIALCGLDEAPLRTQAALAQAIGADKTRFIGVLDDLQERGFIRREPDPADRRAHLLSVTAKGRRVRDAARAGIRRREEKLLARLSASARRNARRTLSQP